jgi:hypothetical protein
MVDLWLRGCLTDFLKKSVIFFLSSPMSCMLQFFLQTYFQSLCLFIFVARFQTTDSSRWIPYITM